MYNNLPIKTALFTFLISVVLAVFSYSVPAKVNSVDYLKGLNGLAQVAGQQIKISFSRPMNQESVNKAFNIAPTVKGNLNWVGDVLFFTPSEPLTLNSEYKIWFDEGAKARDAYGKSLSVYSTKFKTAAYSYAFIGNDDQLYLGDLEGNTKKLTSNKVIKEFVTTPGVDKIFYLDRSGDGAKTKIYSVSIAKGETTEILSDVDADFSSLNVSSDGKRVYVLGLVKEKEGLGSQMNIFEYNLENGKKRNIPEIIKNHTNLVSLWLLPDGNTFLFNDYEANFYIRPVDGDKSSLIGKYTDFFGGATLKGDKLLFGDTVATENYRPFIKIYDGKSTRVVDNGDSVIFYEISPFGDYAVYSYLPKGEEEDTKDKRVGIKMVKLDDGNTIYSHIEPEFSFERPKVSPDSKILAVEVYKRQGHFLDIFGVSTTKEYPQIKFIDLRLGAILEKSVEGKKLKWLQ